MRLVKEDNEIEAIKSAAEITTQAHLACMAKLNDAENERDIEAVLAYFFKTQGGSGEAYTPIVAGGNNANVLHYIENDSKLVNGELLLIDAGAEYGLYACDVTRTIPIGGKFSETQKKVYNIVLEAQKAAIEASRPGTNLPEIHKVASLSLINGLISLGVLKGEPEEIYRDGEHKKFYPHGTGVG